MAPPKNIDEYIARSSPAVRAILKRIRSTIRNAAPDAREAISYRMPAFFQHGVLVYFAAFRNHIGLYPPVSGDASIEKAISPYAGPKGNLRFPLDRPIPYALIERIVKLRVKQDLAKAAATPGAVPGAGMAGRRTAALTSAHSGGNAVNPRGFGDGVPK
jgi:uncharacterized protein YdhG (YjbR/CyaY superfamily)